VPALGSRLDEIDRKLRAIQVELAPDREPPPQTDREPDPHVDHEPTPERAQAPAEDHLAYHIDRLATLQTILLSAMADAVASLKRALAESPSPAAPAELTVSAGPFSSIEALRAFEQDLAGLPNVHHVEVRGYEGEDRALIEVRLSSPTT
jgi:hypothetical protein